VVDVGSFLASAALIGSVAIARAESPQAMETSSDRIHAIWGDMRKGMESIFHHAALLFVILAMAAGLFTIGCFGPLISIYVRDTLRADSGTFGIISGAVGFGTLFGPQRRRQLT